MHFQYEVNINISIKAITQNHLSVLTDTKEKAVKELKKWADKYRQEWGVPAESTEDWEVEESDVTDELVKINFKDTFKDGRIKSRYFFGNVYPHLTFDDGDETALLAGTVFKYNEFPHIMCNNRYPTLVNDPQVTLTEPFDMKEHMRTEWPKSDKGISLATSEETEEYYLLRSAIIHKECSMIK